MSASFDNPWFESAGAVGDLAGGNLAQHREAMTDHLRGGDQLTGKRHPRRQHVLARPSEADRTRLFAEKNKGEEKQRKTKGTFYFCV